MGTQPKKAMASIVETYRIVSGMYHRTVVGTQNYTVHRWKAAFPNPEEFLPDQRAPVKWKL